MTVPKKPVAGFLTLGLLLLAASPGQANHVAGATYTGTYDGGGTMGLDVSDDGTTVTHFEVTLEGGRPCADITITPAMPITNHAFTGPFGPRLSVSGSFPGGRSAEGTFALRGVPSACPSGTVPWSAAVDRTGPALRLGGRRSQSIHQRNVLVVAGCPDEECAATARGTIRVPGARRFKLRKARAGIFLGDRKETLGLRISRGARGAAKKALRQREKVVAKVRVTARDHGGNITVRTRTIRLKK